MAAYKKILVALDYSANGDDALRHGIALSRDTGARLLAIHAVPPYDPVYFDHVGASSSPDPSRELKARAKLTKHVAKLVGRTPIRYQAELQWGDPAPTVIQTAEKCGADLIVVGRNGCTVWEHLLMGSVAEKIVHHAACPVLVIAPRGRRKVSKLTRKRRAAPRRRRRAPYS
jgi:nucleotide-binding universal stress UspA family protein